MIDPVFVGALALMAIAVWQITGDGEAVLFEGLALIALLRRARDARLVRVDGHVREPEQPTPSTARRGAAAPRPRRGSAPATRRPRRRARRGPRRPVRRSRTTGCPTASHIRRTWRLRPSWRTSSTRERPSCRARAGAVTPSSSSTPVAERRDRGRRQVALDVGDVGLLDAVARVREAVGEVAVVREQEDAARVDVQPTDGHDPRFVADEVDDGRATLPGSLAVVTTPERLVEQDVRELLLADPLTVDLDDVPAPRRRCSARPRRPLTVTRPALISSSAARRDATPARAR